MVNSFNFKENIYMMDLYKRFKHLVAKKTTSAENKVKNSPGSNLKVVLIMVELNHWETGQKRLVTYLQWSGESSIYHL